MKVVLAHPGEHVPRGHIWAIGARSGAHRVGRRRPTAGAQIGSIDAPKEHAPVVQNETRRVGLASHALEDPVDGITEVARCDVATRESTDRWLLREVSRDW